MVTVTTNSLAHERQALVNNIREIMRDVTSITPRDEKQLLTLLDSNDIALAFDNTKLVGWVVAVPYSSNVQELGMAYTLPEYRKQGIFVQMIDLLINKRPVSIAITYENQLVEQLARNWKFEPSSLLKFVTLTNGKFIADRLRSIQTIKTILTHVSHAKPVYLIRNKYEK